MNFAECEKTDPTPPGVRLAQVDEELVIRRPKVKAAPKHASRSLAQPAVQSAAQIAESGRGNGRAELLANSGRRGIGRFPRKCKPRGPCGDPPGTLTGPRTFRRGLWRNFGKFRQKLIKV